MVSRYLNRSGIGGSLAGKDDDLTDVLSREELFLGLRDLGQGKGAADLGPDIAAVRHLDKAAEMNPLCMEEPINCTLWR